MQLIQLSQKHWQAAIDVPTEIALNEENTTAERLRASQLVQAILKVILKDQLDRQANAMTEEEAEYEEIIVEEDPNFFGNADKVAEIRKRQQAKAEPTKAATQTVHKRTKAKRKAARRKLTRQRHADLKRASSTSPDTQQLLKGKDTCATEKRSPTSDALSRKKGLPLLDGDQDSFHRYVQKEAKPGSLVLPPIELVSK